MMEFYQFICMAIFMLVLADACLWVDLTKHFDNNVETTARVWKKITQSCLIIISFKMAVILKSQMTENDVGFYII